MTFSQTKLLTILHGQNGVKVIYEGAVAVRTLPSLRIDISFYVELDESKTLEVKRSPKCQPSVLNCRLPEILTTPLWLQGSHQACTLQTEYGEEGATD